MIRILRDGKDVARATNQFTALHWFHQHTVGSMDYALRYMGYSIVETTEPEEGS
jgi:hypothetical protein